MNLPPNFWTKVDKTDSCWLWTGALNGRGYPCFAVGGRSQLAHRLAYEAFVAPVPAGLTIDHLCRVKRCVNPAQLDPCTRRENALRAVAQDRPHACPRGHAYTPQNSRIRRRPGGRYNRTCRTCEHDARQRKAAA